MVISGNLNWKLWKNDWIGIFIEFWKYWYIDLIGKENYKKRKTT